MPVLPDFRRATAQNDSRIDFDPDEEGFVQMDAVVADHGVWTDPSDYYRSAHYLNRPSRAKLWFYRRIIGGVNERVDQLRSKSPEIKHSGKR